MQYLYNLLFFSYTFDKRKTGIMPALFLPFIDFTRYAVLTLNIDCKIIYIAEPNILLPITLSNDQLFWCKKLHYYGFVFGNKFGNRWKCFSFSNNSMNKYFFMVASIKNWEAYHVKQVIKPLWASGSDLSSKYANGFERQFTSTSL